MVWMDVRELEFLLLLIFEEHILEKLDVITDDKFNLSRGMKD